MAYPSCFCQTDELAVDELLAAENDSRHSVEPEFEGVGVLIGPRTPRARVRANDWAIKKRTRARVCKAKLCGTLLW